MPATGAHRSHHAIPFLLALCIGLGSCDAGYHSTIEVAVYANNTRDLHPSFPDSVVVGNNSLVDSAGLAGLEVSVMGRTSLAIPYCDGVLRMRIEDSAANFLEEAIWLLWVGIDIDPPAAVVN